MYEVYLRPVPGLTRYDRLTQAGADGLRLPVPPLGALTRNISPVIRVTETSNNGQFSWPSGPALREVTFSSVFPEPEQVTPGGVIMPSWAHQLGGSQQYQEPGWWASTLMTMSQQGIIFQLFITTSASAQVSWNGGVHTNHMALIRAYTDYEDEGDARYYNITFQEFRQIVVRKVKKKVKKPKPARKPGPARSGSRPRPSSAKVTRSRQTPARTSGARRA